MIAHAHDRTFAELLFNLAQGALAVCRKAVSLKSTALNLPAKPL